MINRFKWANIFKIFSMSSADTEMKDAETALSEEVMQMSTEDLVARTRLIDNECKMMRSGIIETSYLDFYLCFRTCAYNTRDHNNERKN